MKFLPFIFLLACIQEESEFVVCGGFYEGVDPIVLKTDCKSLGKVKNLEICEAVADEYRRAFDHLNFHCE